MDKMEILERLISIKNNASERARQESNENPVLYLEIKAFILQNGVEQLIMEIQNDFLAEHQITRSGIPYRMRVSSQAS